MAISRLEKIANWDEEIAKIKAKQKTERTKHNREVQKARTRRLCSRHGLLESMIPAIIEITDEQYKTFLERAVANDYGKDILAKIVAQGAKATPTKTTGVIPPTADKTTATQANTAEPSDTPTNPKTTGTIPPTADNTDTKPTNTPPQNNTATSKNNGNHGNNRNQQPHSDKGNGTATV